MLSVDTAVGSGAKGWASDPTGQVTFKSWNRPYFSFSDNKVEEVTTFDAF